MRVTDFCPSPHLEALDCGDRLGDELIVTIKGAERKKVGAESVIKGVIYFDELDRGLVLNKTNSRTIAAMYGSDTDQWMGQKITIYRGETSFQGKVVPCIRVRENGHKKSK